MKKKALSLLLVLSLLLGMLTILGTSASVDENVCATCGQALDGVQGGVRGDLNGDGVVDIADIVEVIDLAAGVYIVTFVDYDGTVLKTETVASGKSATAPAVPAREGYTFVGWDKSFERVTGNITVTALWQEPLYIRDGNYMYFGEYPQSIKADSVTITATTDGRGYYLGSDGAYYAKVTATPYASGCKFSTGAALTSGSVYYFKVEPIRWRILSESEDTALILCDSIIANQAYDANKSNNYAESDVRAWLNAEFYNTAFTELERELINTVTVDNSAATTGDTSNSYWMNNQYACANTSDKLFLLSYKEVTESAYGFATSYNKEDTARRMQTSDYTRATGAFIYMSSGYYGSGIWWLRSPNYYSKGSAREVLSSGSVSNGLVHNADRGVVPALELRLR